MFFIYACLTVLIYWIGYGDGKLSEQEKNGFEKLDKLIQHTNGSFELPLEKERPPYDPEISMMKPIGKYSDRNTEMLNLATESRDIAKKTLETINEINKSLDS